MPSEKSHIGVANDNHATLEYLLKEPDNHLAWIGTVAFYKALHVVEAGDKLCDSPNNPHGTEQVPCIGKSPKEDLRPLLPTLHHVAKSQVSKQLP